ncbi:MAG: DNA methyltransferase, partial [Thermoplasmata archaeon]
MRAGGSVQQSLEVGTSVPVRQGTPILSPDNRLSEADRRVHQWYRFVLSFPPHLVRHYVNEFKLGEGSSLLDPFCGTGMTLVEAKKLVVPSAGIEAHPFTAFA